MRSMVKYAGSFFLMLIACQVFSQRSHYLNVLDLQTTINNYKAITPTAFSDLGAWHAYALPDTKTGAGGFVGPLLMDMNGRWLANSFSQLQLREKGKMIDLRTAKANLQYFPGLLQQQLVANELTVLLQLIFVSSREAMIRTKIINHSPHKRTLELSNSGQALLPGTRLRANGRSLLVQFSGNDHRFMIHYPGPSPVNIQVKDTGYTTSFGEVSIPSNGSFAWEQVQAFYPSKDEKVADGRKYTFETELTKNTQRWNAYLHRFFSRAGSLKANEKKLAVKSIITLLTNWRSASKDLLHDGVFPSINYQGFYGVWSWDSWKQAVALGFIHPKLAQDNILCMFDYQDAAGMVPDCIYSNKNENNLRDTKPALSAWAVWEVFQQSKDRAFLEQLYPKLMRYHNWWYTNRDHDQNGLCEYGSTDGTRIAAAWESGMDNAVRFDSAVMLKNNETAWSLDQESVDLNAYLAQERVFLSKIATTLGKRNEATAWKKRSDSLAVTINANFFHAGKGYYYDKRPGHNNLITVEGPEGWIPLWAGIATPQQAKAIQSMMATKNKFNTLLPLPTLAADHPAFDPMQGYWRGPVWLDQFYFGIVGLKQYGYKTLANELQQKLWQHAEGLFTDSPVFENYHPLTGKGLNARNFSWSAAHLLLLLKSR